MKTGYDIAQLLKTVKAPDGNDRLARAMFVANALAYSINLKEFNTAAEAFTASREAFVGLLNEINENVAVDTRLAEVAFRNALQIRFELLYGVVDPSVIKMALTSYAETDNEITDRATMAEWLASRSDFATAQIRITEILDASFKA